ncbi:substrate-binding domain-containing protein [Streptomyces sp. ZAF1911]|nr:substrate-binding domain-containing protein [Streptomyces sp. ZAF1911]MDD9375811.1 substrate-binding domain-containing protein [Streptomyces sp. ZAF1911]
MRYTVNERHERILELVREHGTLRVADLAHHLGISTVTARRDVESLTAGGRLERVRGAVHWPGTPAPQPGAAHALPEVRLGAVAELEAPLIGMVVPQSQHYFGEIIRGAREAAAAVGGRLVLGFSGYQPDQDNLQAARMLEAGVQGLLLTPSWASGEGGPAESGAGFGVPAVLVERRGAVGAPVGGLDHVCSDHAGGAGLAVRHLVGLGHRKIALVAGDSPTTVQVKAGYEAALRAFGVRGPAIEPIELYSGAIDNAKIDAAADRLAALVAARKVTAAIVLSDTDAILLLQALRDRAEGIRVPQDLALVAYGDDVAALSDLPLTAIAPPKYEVGVTAVDLLLQRIREAASAAQPKARRHLDLVPELRVRQSCGSIEKD